MNQFTHLHLHSIYSVLDAVIKFDPLVKRLKQLGMTSCALTDHGTMGGIINFYNTMKKNDIKPIIGMEAYVTFDKDNAEKKFKDNYHMVIMAQNTTGYKNLTWLSSNAYINNFYYKPRINWELLLERNEGLIITSACLGGVWGEKGRASRDDKENEYLLEELTSVYKDRLYLELQPHDMSEQRQMNEWLQVRAQKFHLPTVLTTDCHYLLPDDHRLHAMVMSKKMKMDLQTYEETSERKYGNGFYVKSAEEMYNHAKALGDISAYENTAKIAEECNLELKFGDPEMPHFDIKQASDYNEFLEWKKKLVVNE